MAQAVSRQSLTAEARVSWGIYWIYDGQRVTGIGFLRVLPLSVTFHQARYSCITWGVNNRPVGGRSSETYSHPTDMNKLQANSCQSMLGCKQTQPPLRLSVRGGGGGGVKHHPIKTAVLYEGEWSASGLGCFTSTKIPLHSLNRRGREPQSRLCWEIKILVAARNRTMAIQSITWHL
jgi:hypothetical protein